MSKLEPRQGISRTAGGSACAPLHDAASRSWIGVQLQLQDRRHGSNAQLGALLCLLTGALCATKYQCTRLLQASNSIIALPVQLKMRFKEPAAAGGRPCLSSAESEHALVNYVIDISYFGRLHIIKLT